MHSPENLRNALLSGDRLMLAKAITLVESTLPPDQERAAELINAILPHTGKAVRIGITGAPGVGKSTFIETFGRHLIGSGKKVAVLTVDPSSQVSRGSILGDKTRMQELARDNRAFIRPSPSGNALGGVAAHTRETILLCESAGFEYVIVETVGTGQSETAIRHMVDFFLLLVQSGAGDELQGIKKGIVEMADAIAVTKADGENLRAAELTQSDFRHALHLQQPQPSGWTPKVLLCSAIESSGMDEIHKTILEHREQLSRSGHFEANRRSQNTAWFSEHFQYLLSIDPLRFPDIMELERKLKKDVQSGELSARSAARKILDAYHQAIGRSLPPSQEKA